VEECGRGYMGVKSGEEIIASEPGQFIGFLALPIAPLADVW